MLPAKSSAKSIALRFALIELVIVLAGLVFVRKDVYLAGHFKSMLLHWQEYALLVLTAIDGFFRGLGEWQGRGQYLSAFRKKFLRYLLPITLFLFISCASLCGKYNFGCFPNELWRDSGLLILGAGIFINIWQRRTCPEALLAIGIMRPRDGDYYFVNDTAGDAPDSKDMSPPVTDPLLPANPEAATDPMLPADPEAASELLLPASQEAATDPLLTASQEAVTDPLLPANPEAASDSLLPANPEAASDSLLPASAEAASDSLLPASAESASDLLLSASAEAASDPLLPGSPQAVADPLLPAASEAFVADAGPWKILRYPDRTAILVELIGASIALSAWLPLLTLPGLVVAFKWEFADLEAFRISQFGESYLNYKKKSWCLIPFVF